MTDGELGVIGAQAAKAERFHRFREEQQKVIGSPAAEVEAAFGRGDDEAHLRITALQYAALSTPPDTLPENVVARAETYLTFIKGETDG